MGDRLSVVFTLRVTGREDQSACWADKSLIVLDEESNSPRAQTYAGSWPDADLVGEESCEKKKDELL